MASRSTFVSVLAWIFIVGAGFTSLVSIMQVIMVSTLTTFSGDAFQSMPDDTPATIRFMWQYFHLFVYGYCAVSIFTFISAIGLLKRRNWARLAFIGIFVFGVFWQLGAVFMQFAMLSDFPVRQEAPGFEDFERIKTIVLGFSLLVALAISGLFVWLIRKLTTQPIIGEFAMNTSTNSPGPKAASVS